jgi:hypothetical protein
MRPENWPELLDEYLREAQRMPFAWGRQDCCTLAADWVRLIRGVDPMAAWRGQYRTAAGAVRAIEAGGGLASMVSSVLGDPIPVTFAQRGDVVLAELERGPTMGIVIDHRGMFPGLDGAEARLLSTAVQAWRV